MTTVYNTGEVEVCPRVCATETFNNYEMPSGTYYAQIYSNTLDTVHQTDNGRKIFKKKNFFFQIAHNFQFEFFEA